MKITQELVEIRENGVSRYFVFSTPKRAVQFLTSKGLAANWINVGTAGVRYYFKDVDTRHNASLNASYEDLYNAVIRTIPFNVEARA